MDLSFFTQYLVYVIVGICLCVGYVIKHSLNFIPNKYIPLIMLILGTLISVISNHKITADVVLAGMYSGLFSTGLHQLFKNLIKNK